VLVHINHPDELTRKVLNVLHKIKKTGAEILTQTVFLKGINDDVEVLKKMCTILYHNRIRPYYIYRCDYVRGLERFIVPLRREKKIMTELRKHLSGPAYPLYVIDLPDGRGKIPPPLDFWKGTGTHNCFDFDGKKIRI
jgi:lysine 2,3-aminomutase